MQLVAGVLWSREGAAAKRPPERRRSVRLRTAEGRHATGRQPSLGAADQIALPD